MEDELIIFGAILTRVCSLDLDYPLVHDLQFMRIESLMLYTLLRTSPNWSVLSHYCLQQ